MDPTTHPKSKRLSVESSKVNDETYNAKGEARARSKSMYNSPRGSNMIPKGESQKVALSPRSRKSLNVKPKLARNSLTNGSAEAPLDLDIDAKASSNSVSSTDSAQERALPEFDLLKSSILIKVNTGSYLLKEKDKGGISAQGNLRPEATKVSSPGETTTDDLREKTTSETDMLPATPSSGEANKAHPSVDAPVAKQLQAAPESSPVDMLHSGSPGGHPTSQSESSPTKDPETSSATIGKDDASVVGSSPEILPGVPNATSTGVSDASVASTSCIPAGQGLESPAISSAENIDPELRNVHPIQDGRGDLTEKSVVSSLSKTKRGFCTVKSSFSAAVADVGTSSTGKSSSPCPTLPCAEISSAGIPCAGGPCCSPSLGLGHSHLEALSISHPNGDASGRSHVSLRDGRSELFPENEPAEPQIKTTPIKLNCLEYRKSRIDVGCQAKPSDFRDGDNVWIPTPDLSPINQLLRHHGSLLVWSPVAPLAQHVRWDKGCARHYKQGIPQKEIIREW